MSKRKTIKSLALLLTTCLLATSQVYADSWKNIALDGTEELVREECTAYRLVIKSEHLSTAVFARSTKDGLSEGLSFPIGLSELVALNLAGALSPDATAPIRKADLTSMDISLGRFNKGDLHFQILGFTHAPSGGAAGLGFDAVTAELPLDNENLKVEALCADKPNFGGHLKSKAQNFRP